MTTAGAPDRVPDTVDAVELIRVRLPLLEPFVTSHGTEHDRDVILVRVDDAEGRSGWGECSTLSEPTYTAEHTDGAWTVLRDELVPSVLRRVPDERGARARHPMAWCAVDTALRDLAARVGAGVGADTPRPVGVGCVVGRPATVADIVATVERRVAEGYRLVKLKIGPGWDLEPLRAVRVTWPTLALAADANGAYGSDATLFDAADGIDAIGLTYLEQPLAPDDLAGMAALQSRLDTPLALDEAVSTARDLEAALAAGAGRVLNVKPARVGGLGAARALAATARDGGLQVFVGGMLETGVGRSAALRLAGELASAGSSTAGSSTDGSSTEGLPTDVGPSSRYFARDVTEPIECMAPGVIRAPDTGGLVLAPLADRLDEFAVDRVRVHR